MQPRIYVYGIIDSAKGPEFQRTDRRIYSIAYQDVAAVVSDCALLEDFTGAVEERALFHEGVVETLMDDFTVLPMRLLSVFGGREQVVSMLCKNHVAFKANFTRLAQKVEFGLKVLWPSEKIRERIGTNGKLSANFSNVSPAKAFMLEKLEEYKHEKAFLDEAETLTLKVDAFFSGLAAEKKLRKLQTERLLLNASYLVKKDVRMTDAFDKLKTALPELEYQFSGPWPPYNFIVLPHPQNED